MKHPEYDIIASDEAFISFSGAMLVGIGLVMLTLGIMCSWMDWGLCEVRLVNFPFLELIIRQEFVALNLPLGMLIIGIGLQLFNRLGWIVALVILVIFWVIFGVSSAKLFPVLFYEGLDYTYVKEAVLNSVFFLLITLGMLYLLSPSIRKLYFDSQN